MNATLIAMPLALTPRSPPQLIEVDGTKVQPMLLPYIVLNCGQRASVVLDWSDLHPALQKSPAIWFRFAGMPDMYPTFEPEEKDFGLIGIGSGKPLDLLWKGIFRFVDDGKVVQAPGYTVPPQLHTAPQAEVNILAARPLFVRPAPDPEVHINMEVSFRTGADGVNRGYINGHTFVGPTAAGVRVPVTHCHCAVRLFIHMQTVRRLSNSQVRDPVLFRYLRGDKETTPGGLVGFEAPLFVLPYNKVRDPPRRTQSY